MQVAVDGRALVGPRTGIGAYTAAVLDEWAAAGRTDAVTVLDTDTLGRPFHLKAAAYAKRHRLRYWSPDSLIVPALLGDQAVATVHDLAPLLRPETHTVRVRAAYRTLLATAVRRARAVVTPSEATRADLLVRFPGAHVVVTGAGPRRLPAPGALPAGVRPPYLLYVGALEPRKHAVDLADAFLAAAPPDWQLVLAGPRRWLGAADVARLDRLAADHPDRVLPTGHADDPTVAALYCDAAALAYPSEYEGFGLPVVEAMAAGVPVLTTTAAALREVAGDAALLVDLAGPDPYGAGLRDAVAAITTDAPLRERLAAAGRARAGIFTWASAADAVWGAITS